MPFQLYIVPEVRLAAVRQAIFDRPMPPRLLRLFARVAGAEPVRRWQTAHVKPVKVDEKRGVEVLPRRSAAAAPRRPARCDEDGRGGRAPHRAGAAGRRPRWRRGRRRRTAAPKRPGAVDKAEVAEADRAPLQQRGREGARRADDDHQAGLRHQGAALGGAGGRSTRTTTASSGCSRGSAHKEPRIRASSEDELRKLTGEYFGYHYDLPRREREQARERWQKWWYESGARGPTRREPSIAELGESAETSRVRVDVIGFAPAHVRDTDQRASAPPSSGSRGSPSSTRRPSTRRSRTCAPRCSRPTSASTSCRTSASA